MRRLFRLALTIFTVGIAMIGCNRSSSPDPAEGRSDPAPGDAPFQAAFRVPGMT